MKQSIAQVQFTSYSESVTKALDAICAFDVLSTQTNIIVKPNLINASPHPITTHPDCCKAIVEYIRSHSGASVTIAEGCGDAGMETDEVFQKLGYSKLAKELNVDLVDLNHAPLQRLENTDCRVFPEMYLPEIAFNSYIISVPVLKAHSLADITGSLKNMMGFAPPKYYSGRGGSWKKAVFHIDMHQSIIDLNKYLTPDLSIVDAVIGMPDFHLGGRTCDPPVNMIIAGYNALEVDRLSAGLLNMDWQKIDHLR